MMESIRRADILRDLQARSHQRLAEQGIAEEDLDERIRTSYKADHR